MNTTRRHRFLMRYVQVLILFALLLALPGWKPIIAYDAWQEPKMGLDAQGQLYLASGEDTMHSGSPAAGQKDNAEGNQFGDLIDLAKADLAQRLGVALDEVSLWAVRSETFRDSSLGQPQAGRLYLQVLTPGCVITLRVGDGLYTYHGADTRVVFIGRGAGKPVNLPDVPLS